MSLIYPLIPTDLDPKRKLLAPLGFVAAWGAIPSEPLLHPPSLREPLSRAHEKGFLQERPTPFGYTLVLTRKGFLELSLPATSMVPNERSRSYRLLAYLVGSALKPDWPRIRRCKTMVYVLEGRTAQTALLFLSADLPTPHLRNLLLDRYQCGGTAHEHHAFYYFSPREPRSPLPAHVIKIAPPELTLWLERLRASVNRLY